MPTAGERKDTTCLPQHNLAQLEPVYRLHSYITDNTQSLLNGLGVGQDDPDRLAAQTRDLAIRSGFVAIG